MPLFQVGPSPNQELLGTIYPLLSQNLEAFWPGLLSMVGDNEAALKSLHNYHQAIQSLFLLNFKHLVYWLVAGLEAVWLHTRVLQRGARRGGRAEGGFPSQT